MEEAIKRIEEELKKSRARCSTSNNFDSSYSCGLEFALKQLKTVKLN